ncbi:MAG: zinc ribbon domain-containing protein [Chloroflexi bacterium]|nr:zinc ribbon domain-containing protein [Chloroflexota bacterium]
MSRNRWFVVLGVVLAVVVLAPALFMTGWMLSGSAPGSFVGMPHMGYWPGGFGMGGWLFMLLRAVIPVAVLGLAAWGIVSLVSGGRKAEAPLRACAGCGRAAQTDWRNCPYCGKALA